MNEAEERIAKIERQFTKSSLPAEPDFEQANKLLVHIRDKWYTGGGRSMHQPL